MKSLHPLWRTYLFIVISSIITAIAIILVQWKNIKHNASDDLTYANRIMTSSIQSVLHKNEALLKILGERLVELGALDAPNEQAMNLINELLHNNNELAGIGLATPEGQLVLTSFNIDRKKLPNLLALPETAMTFKKALKSQTMVVGRTYYMAALKQWLIPLRYRITNKDGEVTAVMTTGLKLVSTRNVWSSTRLPEHMSAVIIRKDLYRQYIKNIKPGNIDKVYKFPISTKKRDSFEMLLKSQTGMNIYEFRVSDKIVTMDSLYGKQDMPVFTSVSYDSTYEHYTLIYITRAKLFESLIIPISLLLALLSLFNFTLFWIFRSNIDIQRQSKARLAFQATHDELTQLPNRRYLMEKFNSWKEKYNGHFSILFIDLDNFKAINDIHGHSIGDRVLRTIAERIKESCQDSLKIRQGGDEFIILNYHVKTDEVMTLCQRCLQTLRQPIVIDGLEFVIGASIGTACAPDNGIDVDELLRKADMAMYEAKRTQSGVYAFSERLEKLQHRKSIIESELGHALERGEFHLVYQPQVDAKNHSIIGIETLIRWQNPTLGMVSPEEFITIAEATGQIIDIGLYVLKTSLNEITELYREADAVANIRLSINVSVRQLLSENFLQQFYDINMQYINSAIKLVVEITENLFIDDVDQAIAILESLQRVGVDISLDDFGTGYSSLNILNKLPINELKIDKSFVRDILLDEQDKQLVRSIIGLGKSLSIPVLAEGVEDKAQADMLNEYGCDLFQGYYFSRPIKKEDLKKLIFNTAV
jgi:diguanylate cyclase (GGDEF)-like protein